MRNNLIAEMVKRGYQADQVPKVIASLLGCSERTVRNKLRSITDFTVTEALLINNEFFNDTLEFKYLFENFERQPQQSA